MLLGLLQCSQCGKALWVYNDWSACGGMLYKHLVLTVLEFIREGCHGKSRDLLESMCERLPDEDCIPHPYMNGSRCDEEEFDCGDGQCIPGLGVCDNKFHCMNGQDELNW